VIAGVLVLLTIYSLRQQPSETNTGPVGSSPARPSLERGSTTIERGQRKYTLVTDWRINHYVEAARGDGVPVIITMTGGDHYVLNDILHGPELRPDICMACYRQWSQLSYDDQEQLKLLTREQQDELRKSCR
jgi:hypothetical protein